jgi:hypothetical protein
MKCSLLFGSIFIFLVSLANAADNNSALMQLGKLTNPNPGINFGQRVAASGNTIVVEGFSSAGLGEFNVFVKPSSGWGNATESATLAPSNGNAAFFTASISGNTIVVWALDGGVSAAYVFGK